jgi:hypothetical protein
MRRSHCAPCHRLQLGAGDLYELLCTSNAVVDKSMLASARAYRTYQLSLLENPAPG